MSHLTTAYILIVLETSPTVLDSFNEIDSWNDTDIGIQGLEASWREWKAALTTSSQAESSEEEETDTEADTTIIYPIEYDARSIIRSEFNVQHSPDFSEDTVPSLGDFILPKVLVTFGISAISMILALIIPGVSSVWTLIGSLISPGLNIQ